jgi:hypothetical protein
MKMRNENWQKKKASLDNLESLKHAKWKDLLGESYVEWDKIDIEKLNFHLTEIRFLLKKYESKMKGR